MASEVRQLAAPPNGPWIGTTGVAAIAVSCGGVGSAQATRPRLATNTPAAAIRGGAVGLRAESYRRMGNVLIGLNGAVTVG